MVTPRSVGLLGAGVIGGGWAARFVLAGVDVRLFDPSPEAATAAFDTLERARRAWRRLTLAPMPDEGTLTLTASVEEAVAGVELVQESAPEREELKRALLAQASAAAPPGAIIATSTSGLLPTRLAAEMRGPERFVVGHPFNPVYLLPLVEVCGAQRTSPETVARTAAMYRSVAMRPLIVRHEIDGFIADRLLEALWREALWLVADDVATAEEVDDAIRYGAGLRWAAMGTFLTYRLAGGDAGMRHFMAQFGPALQLPWTHLTDVPELGDELLDKLVAQSDAQAGGRSIAELTRIRDDCLIAVLRGLKGAGFAAGEVVALTERELYERAGARTGRPPLPDGRLRLHEALVEPSWIDYNGHMTEHRYLEVMADTTDAFLRTIGVIGPYIDTGRSYYTVETHIRHLGEARGGDRISVATRLLGHDSKRLHLFHELRRDEDDGLIATGEHLLLHVARDAGATTPAAPEILAALQEIAAAQRELPWPEGASNQVRGPRVQRV
ncbi:MAG TPA: carnitine 3-dehydrogenase [Solirubrobacteraceae bacterium]|jgi:carnitine 3-dehydrogenase|nr:carnitine 3-dehydrogenase [Solirubrobacteraceae bacterium]